MTEEIDELQARLAFQDETIDTLNQQVTELSATVVSLQKQMQVLYKKMDDLAYAMQQQSNSVENPVDEKPPHY